MWFVGSPKSTLALKAGRRRRDVHHLDRSWSDVSEAGGPDTACGASARFDMLKLTVPHKPISLTNRQGRSFPNLRNAPVQIVWVVCVPMGLVKETKTRPWLSEGLKSPRLFGSPMPGFLGPISSALSPTLLVGRAPLLK